MVAASDGCQRHCLCSGKCSVVGTVVRKLDVLSRWSRRISTPASKAESVLRIARRVRLTIIRSEGRLVFSVVSLPSEIEVLQSEFPHFQTQLPIQRTSQCFKSCQFSVARVISGCTRELPITRPSVRRRTVHPHWRSDEYFETTPASDCCFDI